MKKKRNRYYKLYYKYKGRLYGMNVKNFKNENDYDKSKIINAIKTSVKRRFNISLDQYIIDQYNYKLKKCSFCDEFSIYDLDFKFEEIIINKKKNANLLIINNLIYEKYYCKGKNENCQSKKLNPNSKEFVMNVYNLTEEEAINKIHKRNKSPFYLNNYKNYEDYKKYQSLKERLNKKEYERYIKNLKYSKTKEYYIDKYGLEDGENIWNNINKKKDSMSLSFFLNKYNYNYKKAYKAYKDRIKSVTFKMFFGGSYSKTSIDFFDKIIKLLSIKNYLYKDDEFIIEYVDNDKKRKFYYDFIDLDNNIIIEFNGLKWHPNKNKMTITEYINWKHPFNSEILKEDIEEKDLKKHQIALKNYYKIIVVWDIDGEERNVEIVKNFYKENNLL